MGFRFHQVTDVWLWSYQGVKAILVLQISRLSRGPMWYCGDQVERSRFAMAFAPAISFSFWRLGFQGRSVRVATKRNLPKRVRDAFLHLWATNNLMSTSIAHLAFDLIHT